MSEPQRLTIRIKKGADDRTALTCTRADGTTTWQRLEAGQARFFPHHDLTHYAVETVLDRRNWQLTAPYPDINGQSQATINALAKGFVLGLPADVAIRVTDDGDSVIVDMRSASRYGRYDLGDNAARITDFLGELDQEVAGQVGPAPAE